MTCPSGSWSSSSLAKEVTKDMGIPIAGSRIAVGAAVQQLSSQIHILTTSPFREPMGDDFIQRDPIGVGALIAPWSSRGFEIAEKVDPSLPTGSPNVSTLLVGKGSTVASLLSTHPDVDMVAFTGSSEIGVQIQKGADDNVKRVSQELGGESAHNILPCADPT